MSVLYSFDYIFSRIIETQKRIQSREMRMTWTLFGMSFCYVVCVAPIYVCSVLNIPGDKNLVCFILYWFQVKSNKTLERVISLLFFKYSFNFVIYAARSEQYRKTYLRYLREKLPWLFGIRKTKKHNTIFIINPPIRKTASSPELHQNQVKMDMKLKYSLDLEYEKIIHSYTGRIKVNS